MIELRDIMQIADHPQIRDMLQDIADCGVELGVVEGRLMIQRRDPPPSLARMIRINSAALATAVDLQQRLVTGEMKINRLADNDPDRERLEDFWAELLHQYEAACLVEAKVPAGYDGEF